MTADDKLPEWLKPGHIAKLEDVSLWTVIRMCHRGVFPGAYRFGRQWRIPRGDYLASRKRCAPPAQKPRQAKGKIPGPSRQRAADRVLDAAGIGA